MVMGNIFPNNVLNFFRNICCCLPFPNDLTLILGHPLSNYISMYPKTHVTIPLSNDFEMNHNSSRRGKALRVFSTFRLEKGIKREIKKVLQKRKTQNSEAYLRNKIKSIEKEQVKILTLLEDIRKKL
ncbi:hypothetical protein WA026_017306 [Henosepilachna vigintioctopunctata]|uniref:Uncharacterized protein n=1 Tax=Henosepilachna vigintioctopunctata TaxID=420089 RepID=A0AAW1UQL9_9CUCU